MFGYGKRIKELEDDIKELKSDKACRAGRHDWTYCDGSDWTCYDGSVTQSRMCKHCYKSEEIEIKERSK
jgi:hypothetical protein